MPDDKIFILIEINEAQKITYFKTQLDWVKKTLPEVQRIDFDNLSEAFIVDKTIDIIKNTQKIFVLIESLDASVGLGPVTRFMNVLLRQKGQKIKLILNGESIILEQMGKTLGTSNFYKNINVEDQKKLIINFFTN